MQVFGNRHPFAADEVPEGGDAFNSPYRSASSTGSAGPLSSQYRRQRKRRIVMAGQFELYPDKSGKFRFLLTASNGQVIATGQAYEAKASALNGIESVKKNLAGASTDDQTV